MWNCVRRLSEKAKCKVELRELLLVVKFKRDSKQVALCEKGRVKKQNVGFDLPCSLTKEKAAEK